MIMTNKLLPVALIAALIGGSVGALVMHRSQPATAETTAQDTSKYAGATTAQAQPVATDNQGVPSDFDTSQEQIAYKTGFADGFAAAESRAMVEPTTRTVTPTRSRVVYRNTASRSAPRRVYYDYTGPEFLAEA
jgi:hypothetical protein